MKKVPLKVRHYAAKSVHVTYGGDFQQLFTEVLLASGSMAFSIYCLTTESIGIIGAPFLIPGIMFTIGSLLTAHRIITDAIEKKKQSKLNNGNTSNT